MRLDTDGAELQARIMIDDEEGAEDSHEEVEGVEAGAELEDEEEGEGRRGQHRRRVSA